MSVVTPRSIEAVPLRPAAERATGASTIGRMVLLAAERGDEVALRYPGGGQTQTISYAQMAGRCRGIARGLIALGLQSGDTVSILSSTRVEWTLCDLGSLCAGAVVAPIYHTNAPEECGYVLADSQARLVFCEDSEQAAKIAQIREQCPALLHVVMIDGTAPGAITMDDLIRRGEEVDTQTVDRRIEAVAPGDLVTIVYTSGTTGPPKGCALSHANFIAATTMSQGMLRLDDIQPVVYQFLPLAHVFARVIQTVVLDVGGTLVFWSGDSKRIVADLAEAQPTHLPAVPRIYEKVHTAVMSGLQRQTPARRAVFRWALSEGSRARRRQRAGGRLGPLASARHRLADRLVLCKVRSVFGPRLIMGIVGAAPMSRDLLEFFDACGVLVLEGWGMTETCSVGTLNPPDAPRFGTIGRAMPGCEMRIADDGEILVRGPQVFCGYYRNPNATAELMEGDWLHSGDLGSVSHDGYVSITGRKKDLIITSSGKNIAPQNIETGLRDTRWISHAVVYGDQRPYLVCLLTLDPDEAHNLSEQLGIAGDLASMARDERVHAAVQCDVDANNRRFARIEQIKRFEILHHDPPESNGELTPTLKVKRNAVYNHYAPIFQRLYETGATVSQRPQPPPDGEVR